MEKNWRRKSFPGKTIFFNCISPHNTVVYSRPYLMQLSGSYGLTAERIVS